MTTQTTDAQISAMKQLASKLEEEQLVKSAYIDDWGRFGNFTLMVTPREHDRSTTSRLKALVRKMLPKGAMLREVFGPDPIRERDWNGRMRVVGYSRKSWNFDIDYMHYDVASNSFS